MNDVEWVPQSCTPPTEERPLRVAEWDARFAERLPSLSRPEPLRLRLQPADGSGVEGQIRDLVERETGCCSFGRGAPLFALLRSPLREAKKREDVHAPVRRKVASANWRPQPMCCCVTAVQRRCPEGKTGVTCGLWESS
ncbi:hypothetical protein [Streptomyces sp. NPDC000878]